MSTVQIADVYNPLTFSQFEQEAQIEMNAFIDSGVMVMNPLVSSMLAIGGTIGELPFYKPLGTPEPNYSNDVVGDTSTPNNIASDKMVFRIAAQNQSWSTMDLAVEVALADPVGAINDRVGSYWATTNERRIIQSCLGVLADNVANDSSDMLKTVATDSAAAITDAERINADVIIDAKQTMGDHAMNLAVIALHSVPYSKLQKENLIDFIPDARGEVNIATYQGMRVVVDDSLPAVMGVERITYTTIIFTTGAFAGGFRAPENGSALERDEKAGNGAGEQTLFSRRTDVIHPLGFTFTSTSVAGESATLAELATAANWNRVWSRKSTGLAFLQTNG